MSWRFLLLVLLVVAGFSAWGGINLGNWLVAHGPTTPVVIEDDMPLGDLVLDADGRPFMAQPPQPLIDGRQGIPDSSDAIAWHVPERSLIHDDVLPPIAIATTSISMEQAMAIAEGEEYLPGMGDISELLANIQGGRQTLQPIDMPQAPPPPGAAPATDPAPAGNWELALRQEIQACSRLGFFERPSCAWAARNRYCEPNRAWGKTPDCPAKSF